MFSKLEARFHLTVPATGRKFMIKRLLKTSTTLKKKSSQDGTGKKLGIENVEKVELER